MKLDLRVFHQTHREQSYKCRDAAREKRRAECFVWRIQRMRDEQIRREREWERQRQRRDREHRQWRLGLELPLIPRESRLRLARQSPGPMRAREERVPCEADIRERVRAERAGRVLEVADRESCRERNRAQIRWEVDWEGA